MTSRQESAKTMIDVTDHNAGHNGLNLDLRDQTLTDLVRSLSGESFTKPAAENLGVDPESLSLRPYYVRYKPEANCLIGFNCEIAAGAKPADFKDDFTAAALYAKLYTKTDYPQAVAKAMSRRWLNGYTLEPFVAVPESCAILYFFPNDALLEGLRLVSDPKKIQRALYDCGANSPELAAENWRISDRRLRARIVRYKPERRAVVRCQTKITNRKTEERNSLVAYLRFYADQRARGVANLTDYLREKLQTNPGVTVAQTIGVLQDRSALLVREAPGKTVEELLDSADAMVVKNAVSRAAAALAELHDIDPPQSELKDSPDPIQEAGKVASSLQLWNASLGALAHKTVDGLKDLYPKIFSQDNGLLHGDYHPGQALISSDITTLIDFDRSQIGDQRRDIGEFCARLFYSTTGASVHTFEPEGLNQLFVERYSQKAGAAIDNAALRFWTAQRLLALAETPLRQAQWSARAKIENTLELCLRLLK